MACPLTPSGPVTVVSNNQVISQLYITATGTSAGIDCNGHTGVTISQCIIHHAGGPGIYFHNGATNFTVDHCEIICDAAPANGVNPTNTTWNDASTVNIYGTNSNSPVLSNIRVQDGASGIYLAQLDSPHIFNLNGYNQRGPFPRGQLVQFNTCTNTLLEDFYTFNDLNIAWTEDNINCYRGGNHTIRRGCLDGNNSPSGVGVVCENDTATPSGAGYILSAIQSTFVSDVDTLHQGNGAYGATDSNGVTFTRCRTKNGHNVGVAGRGAPTSNGVSFICYPAIGFAATAATYDNCQYFNPANAGNIEYDATKITHLNGSFYSQDFTPRGPIVLTNMPQLVCPGTINTQVYCFMQLG